MGKYVNTKFNDLSELYLLINEINPKDFKGYLYIIWNKKHLTEYTELNNIEKDFTGSYASPDMNEYIKWLEQKYFCSCNYNLIGFDGEKEYCRFCSLDYLPYET